MARTLPLLQADLDVYARRQIQLHQRVHGLLRGLYDIEHALVSTYLILVPCVLIDVRRDQDREALHASGERDWPLYLSAGPLRGFDDLLRGDVDQTMIERFQTYTNPLTLHGAFNSNRLSSGHPAA